MKARQRDATMADLPVHRRSPHHVTLIMPRCCGEVMNAVEFDWHARLVHKVGKPPRVTA